MSPAETDPWARSSDAFSAASDQLVTALKALAYALAALAEGSMMASFAGLTLLWHHICALGSSAYIEAVSRVGEASVLAQPELPVLIMFLITLAVLYTCILCCCGLRQCGLARFVLVHLLVLPSLAAMLAVPDAHVAVISATRSVVTALREHPHTAPAISTCEVVLAHPLAMSTASAAVSAYGSTYEALVAVAANGVSYPQVQAALSHPHVQTALQHPHVATVVAALEPHLQAMMGHSHFATVAGVWQVLLLASLGWWLLSLCACRRGGKSLGGKPQTRATRAAASDLALAAQAASRKKPKGGSKKGGNGGGGRLRGAGEGELLSDEELRAQVPSALELLFSPIIGAYRLTRSAVTLLTTRAEPPPTKAGRGRGAMHAAALAAADEGSGDGEMHAADASGPPSGAQRLPTSGAGRPKSGGGAEAVPVPARLLTTLKGLRVGEMVTSAALSQDGQLAAAVCTDRTLRIFSGLHHAGGERAILPTPLIGNIPLDHGTACSLSSNGRNVLVGTCQSRHVLAYTVISTHTSYLAHPTFIYPCASYFARPTWLSYLAHPTLRVPPGVSLLHSPHACLPDIRQVTPPGGKAKAGIAFRKEWPQGAREAAHGTPMRAVLLAPNSKFVVTVDERTVKLWSPLSGELVSSVETKQAEQYGASISADSRLVAIAAASSPGGTRKVAPRHGQVCHCPHRFQQPRLATPCLAVPRAAGPAISGFAQPGGGSLRFTLPHGCALPSAGGRSRGGDGGRPALRAAAGAQRGGAHQGDHVRRLCPGLRPPRTGIARRRVVRCLHRREIRSQGGDQ